MSLRAPIALAHGLALALALTACGARPTPTATPTPSGPSPSAAPAPQASSSPSGQTADGAPMDPAQFAMERTPYTAEQIRAATGVGREYVFSVALDGAPPVERVIRFTAVTAEKATFVTESAKADGSERKVDPPAEATWEELRQHAEFPRFAVTIAEARVEVPAGTFDCLVYTVKGEEETITFSFAKALPGPPVKMVVERGGAVVRDQRLVRHRPGAVR